MTNEEKEILYEKWLSGTITPEEKVLLQSSGDERVLEAMIQEVDAWETPDKKEDFDSFFESLESKPMVEESEPEPTNIIPIFRKLLIAASVLIFISLSSYLYISKFSVISHTCVAGEIKKITLPDSTHIILSGNSKMAYNPSNWESNREVKVQGNVFFDVRKKGEFKVQFDDNFVQVLGTQFQVLTTKNHQRVRCFEGKVETSLNGVTNLLTKGMQTDSKQNSTTFDPKILDWNATYEVFEKATIVEVISVLSIQFGYQIDYSNINPNQKFSGKVPLDNWDTATQIIFEPLSIRCEKNGANVILHPKQ